MAAVFGKSRDLFGGFGMRALGGTEGCLFGTKAPNFQLAKLPKGGGAGHREGHCMVCTRQGEHRALRTGGDSSECEPAIPL